MGNSFEKIRTQNKKENSNNKSHDLLIANNSTFKFDFLNSFSNFIVTTCSNCNNKINDIPAITHYYHFVLLFCKNGEKYYFSSESTKMRYYEKAGDGYYKFLNTSYKYNSNYIAKLLFNLNYLINDESDYIDLEIQCYDANKIIKEKAETIILLLQKYVSIEHLKQIIDNNTKNISMKQLNPICMDNLINETKILTRHLNYIISCGGINIMVEHLNKLINSLYIPNETNNTIQPNYQETIPTNTNHKETIPTNTIYQETIQTIPNHQETIPTNTNHQKTIATQQNHQETIPTQQNHQETIPTTPNHQETIPTQQNYQETIH